MGYGNFGIVKSGGDSPGRIQPVREKEHRNGFLIVSLDFELYWGVRDLITVEQCREKLLAGRKAVFSLLELFTRYEIHATWATVGMLFFQSKKDLLRAVPTPTPRYRRRELSPYRDVETLGLDEESDPCRYAPSLIRAIAAVPHQEIGTHTFSHYYCLEDGQDLDSFRADLRAAQHAAERLGIELHSLVFPRNQVNRAYLEVCAELGIKVYRGNNAGWMYAPRQRQHESPFRRALRLVDLHCNVSGHNTYDPSELCGSRPMNLPSSRYLSMGRRWLGPLEPLRIRRIQQEMTYAARHGRVYHLWLHPEDVGPDLERNVLFLKKVLDGFAGMRDRGEIESLNMKEFYHRISVNQEPKGSRAACPSASGGYV